MSFLINGTQVRIDDTHSVNDKVSAADSHIGSTSNPHSTTAAQVGAEPANANIQTHIGSTSNPHLVTYSQVGAEPANINIQNHISSTSNPHSVTATQVGLGNVTNESKATMFTDPTFTGTVTIPTLDVTTKLIREESMTLALSDETTAITTGTAKLTFRSPFAITLTKIPRGSLSTVSTSGNPTIDINKNGVSIFSTTLSIDINEKTSTTATTAAVLSTTTIADDDELTFDIDTAGTGAKGLKVTLYYKRS